MPSDSFPLKLVDLRDYVDRAAAFLLIWQTVIRENATMRESEQERNLSAAMMQAHKRMCAAYDYLMRNRPDFSLPDFEQLPAEVVGCISDALELYGGSSRMEQQRMKATYELVRSLWRYMSVPLRDWDRIEANEQALK